MKPRPDSAPSRKSLILMFWDRHTHVAQSLTGLEQACVANVPARARAGLEKCSLQLAEPGFLLLYTSCSLSSPFASVVSPNPPCWLR